MSKKISIPRKIVNLADRFRKERLAKEKVDKRNRREKETAIKRIRTKRLMMGSVYAKKIFDWARSFRKSGTGQELMRMSHLPTLEKNIFFFDGNVEGSEWVGFVVSPEGLLLDPGGRWSILARKIIKSPSDLAYSVDTKILKTACEWIESGKVWECIERRFGYLETAEHKAIEQCFKETMKATDSDLSSDNRKREAMENEKIKYREQDGKLLYQYGKIGDKLFSTIELPDVPDISGEVPEEICRQGEEAVQTYVKKEIEGVKEVRKRFKEFGENPNVPVSVEYKGVLLEGKIIYANNRYLTARLEKPEKYAGEGRFFGGSLIPGISLKKGDEPKLSHYGIEGAQMVLTWIYDENKNKEDFKDLIELAEKLNKQDGN